MTEDMAAEMIGMLVARKKKSRSFLMRGDILFLIFLDILRGIEFGEAQITNL
jgi:hypothetical protein